MNEKEAISPDSGILLHTVNPSDLHFVWPFIERGLDAIRKRSVVDWLNEDVYATVRSGNAAIIMPFFQNKPVGFVVYYYTVTPFSNRKECLIWCAWTLPLAERSEAGEVDDAVKACFDEIERQARASGASRLTCLSSRKGFARWAAKFGMKPAVTTYLKELT